MSTLSRYSRNIHFNKITPEMVKYWVPSFARWGAVAGLGLLYFGEGIPLVRQDILSKIPFVGSIWAVEPETSE